MKYRTVINLIQAHYEGNAQVFFRASLDVVKELKATGKEDLAKLLSDLLMEHADIRPKSEHKCTDNPFITFEEAEGLCWIPMGETANE